MDILSAALDESGITGDDGFDFDLGIHSAPAQQQPQQVIRSQPVVTPQNGSSVLVNGRPAQVAYNGPSSQQPVFSQALKSLASQNDLAARPGSPMVPSAHSPAIEVSGTSFHRSASSPAIIKLPGNVRQPNLTPQMPQIVRQQSAQLPSSGLNTAAQIVRQQSAQLPSPGPNAATQIIRQQSAQLPSPGPNTAAQIIRQQSAQLPSPAPTAGGKTKIITVKRVGPNGSVTQSRSFTIDGKTAAGIPGITSGTSGQKIIVRRGNGNSSQVVTNPTVSTQQFISTQGGAIKIPTSVLQSSPAQQLIQSNTGNMADCVIVSTGTTSSNSFENQFKKFTNTYSINSGKVTIKESDSSSIGPQSIVRTQPHVIQINRPMSTSAGNSLVNRTVPQSVANNARLVPSQVPSPNPNLHVIHRPFQNATESSSVLKPSLSVPASLSSYPNITNVPPHVLNSRDTNSPPILPIRSMSGLVGGKMVLGNGLNGRNSPNMLDAMTAMYKSAQNVPINVPAKVTSKDVQRMWSNQDIRLKSLQQNAVHMQTSVVEEEEEGEEVEGLGQAETYNEYMPAKLKIGVKHPDAVVETSSMSSIEVPDVHYRLSIPESTIDYGELSALQLESIVYASQRHEMILASGERAGFLIGDGAGVGKGRTIAGVIFENYLLGRKRALWLSVSNDLRVDAERDLRDVGATKIDVHPLNKFKYAKISGKENGNVKKGVVFSTYSSLIGESHSSGKYRTRFKQLVKWCGKHFDGVIVFDECHKAKNLCPTGSSKPTKTGQTVLELQRRLPRARVVYASATGASEPRNMAYMTRLGLWGTGTPFQEFNDFIQAVEKRGVGAMELVAMDMKLRGMYIARQLSFKGVSFKIEEIPIDKDYVKLYNDAVNLWVDARELFQSAAELVDAEHRMRKSMWGQFWSAHQRFFKYLCISAKVPHCVRLAREAIRDGKCVVIGLQSTGEARTLEQVEELGGELNDFVSTAKGVLQTLVEKHFPAPDRKKFFDVFGLNGNSSSFNEDSNSSSAFNGNKRKRELEQSSATKRQKCSSDSDSSSDSEIDFGLSDTSDDSEDSDSDNDDFNPFGNGSDSDDDPWLKRKKKSKSKVKEKKKKEKKKKHKEKKKEKKKSEDDQFDRALAAAGLLKDTPAANGGNGQNNASGDAIEKAFAMKRELLDRIELLGDKLPPNTLDQLIDDMGGPDNVAEMTGRKGRIVCTDEGINYESRSENDVPLEILNLTEKQRFMDGEKNVAIISEAASSGISLQADRRVLNQRRRVHITLELPWSADRAIQQFGRTHRSNQVSAPEYIFLISELAGEQRFASTVSKRLESLGALTHGDRRATETRDLSRFNFDNKFGRLSLEHVMKTVCGYENPMVPLPQDYGQNFLKDAKTSLIGVGMVIEQPPGSVPILEKDYNNISKFLNRLLGMEVKLQNALFRFFSQTMTSIILEAKRSGRWDMGILDLGSGGESVKKLETRAFVGNNVINTAKTVLYTVSVERGMSFPSALDIYKKYQGVEDGFYISLQDRSVHRFAIVAAYQGSYNKKREKMYTVYRPNTGLQPRQETLDEIKKRFKKVLPEEAQRYWEKQYNESATICSHAYWRGSCKKVSLGLPCEIGLRTRTYYILSGSVLSVWNKVESVLASVPNGTSTKMQIIRLRTDDSERIVGSLIPTNCVESLCNVLSTDCSKSYTEKHTEPPPKPREIQRASSMLQLQEKPRGPTSSSSQSPSPAAPPTTSIQPPQPPPPPRSDVYSMPMLV